MKSNACLSLAGETLILITDISLFLRYTLFLFLCSQLFSSELNAQYDFERISNELGLSQNYVTAICQDEQGFLWVGTRNGLNRYDGYAFRTFTSIPGDSLSLSGNIIECLYADSQGRLWIGTTRGLNRFDSTTESFIRYPLLPPTAGEAPSTHSISTFMEDANKNLWVGTKEGVIIYISTNDEVTILPPLKVTGLDPAYSNPVNNDPRILSLILHADGKVWATQLTQVSEIDLDEGTGTYESRKIQWAEILDERWHPLPAEYYRGEEANSSEISHLVFSIREGQKGRIWLKTLDGFGLWSPKKKRFDFTPLDFDRREYLNSPLVGTGELIGESTDGELWIGGHSNFVIYAPKNNRVQFAYNKEVHAAGGDFYYSVKSFFEDNSGRFWLGTRGKGLYTYSSNKQRFKTKEWTGVGDRQSIRSIYQTRDGVLWLGSTNLKFHRWDIKNGGAPEPILSKEFWGRKEKSTFGYVLSMHEDKKGDLWTGCQYNINKIIRENGVVKDIVTFPLINDDGGIFDIHEDEQGELWVITNKKFGKFNKVSGLIEGGSYYREINALPNLTGTPVIHQAKDGVFWLGTPEGLKKLVPGAESLTHYVNKPGDPESLSSNMVKTICPDPRRPDEVLWIGTGGGGLNRFDIAKGKFTRFTTKDGLPDKVVYGILPDETGDLWMSTNQGLAKFDPETETFVNFTAADGLQDNEFNSCAYFKSEEGALFFGGIEGFNGFQPDDILRNTFSPPLVITGLKIANEEVEVGHPSKSLTSAINTAEVVQLSYTDKLFSLEFTSLDFTDTKRNKYAYKLVPFQEDWQYTGHQPNATFTNIDPGRYTFLVKGTNADGLWNEEGASLEIIIDPPWWQTWWFCLTCFIAGAAIIYGIFQYRLEQVLKVERLRIKISNDLHDDVGGMLSGLAMQSELLALNAEEETRQRLDRISSLSRRAMSRMRDTVWAIDNRKDKLTNLIERMREHAEETLSPRNIHHEISIEGINPEKAISTEVRQNLYLISKEAMTNVAKHSNGNSVTIRLLQNTDGFSLSIHDNGIVRAKAYKTTGQGQSNMRMRAEAIGARFLTDTSNGFHVLLSRKRL